MSPLVPAADAGRGDRRLPLRHHRVVPRTRVNPPEVRRSDLSPAWRQFADVCSRLWTGSVHDLEIRGGEPAFAPHTVIVRTVSLTRGDRPCPPDPSDDYAVRREVLELIAHACQLGDGVIERIEVTAGLPRSFQLRGPAAEVLRV